MSGQNVDLVDKNSLMALLEEAFIRASSPGYGVTM